MKKTTWIILISLSIISIVGFWKYFDKVFPIINLTITMDRHQAQKKALEFVQENKFEVQDYDIALQFKENGMLQAFVELEGGGKQAFKDMISNGYHQPYQWAVRFYKPNTINELHVHFTPDGTLNEFSLKIPESQKGAALNKDQALKIALDKVADMNIDMSCYCLVEHNITEQPSGRVDHTFVYEREDVKLEKGLYRIKLKVLGDKFSGFERSVKIPDEFVRRYQQMFADNKLIASVGQNVAIFLYFFVIALLLLVFFYHDHNYLSLKRHGYLILFFWLVMFAASINNWSFLWNFYPTNISPVLFAIQQLAAMFVMSVLFSVFVGIICILADAADRYVFGRHIQFLKSWSSSVVGTHSMFEITLLGYLGAAIFLGYQVMYAFWTQSMGWWSPLGQLFDPNILSTYVPFFTPIASAFRAGFWEEFTFRGLPLAGVAFLTRDSKSKKWWFLLIVIVQALIFGALHANYPQQPAYNRIIELFAPSMLFAAFYYFFGLLPGIITHFVYDAVLMCIPIWASDLYFNKIFAVFCIAIPALVVVIAWLRQGKKFKDVPLDAYNDAKKHNGILDNEDIFQRPVSCLIKSKHVAYITILTALGFVFAYFSNQWNFFNFRCEISRDQAIQIAKNSVDEYGFDSQEDWTTIVDFVNNNESFENKFIWQKYGGMAYQDLQEDYIPAHYWRVAWKKFTGAVEDRAENFQVAISVDGNVLSIVHSVCESQQGADLTPKQAEKIALELIDEIYEIKSNQLNLISSESVKHQNRRDYTIIYKQFDRYAFEDGLGQARITVQLAGDQLLKIKKAIHVPESWQRSEQNRVTQEFMLSMILFVFFLMMILLAVYISLKNVKLSSKFLMPVLFFTLIYFLIKVLSLLNGWNQILAGLNTAEPWVNQVISIVSSYALYFIAIGFMYLFISTIFIRCGTKSICNRYLSWAILLVLVGMSLESFSSWFKQFMVMHSSLDYESQFINFKVPVYGILVAYFLQNVLFVSIQYMSFSIIAQWLLKTGKEFLQIPFFMMVGIILSDVAFLSNIPLWLISGIIVGFIYYLLNKYIISRDMESVFLLSFGMAVMKILPSVWCQVYLGIINQFLLGFCIFGAFILLVYRKI